MSNIDLLRRLVRQQTVSIGGPVTNLLGAVAGQSPAILVAQDQRFLVAQIAGTRLLTPEEFYATYTSAQTRNYQVLSAQEGIIVAQSITKDAGTPSTFLIRSVTENPGPINLPITIETDAPTSEFAVYVDGVLQRRGNGTLSLNLALAAGRRLIEIVAVARVFGLAVPTSIRFIYDLDTVPTPVWSTIRTGYLDPNLGTVALELEWFNDTRVGGWIVFRRVVTYLSAIAAVGLTDGNGEFMVEITGDVESDIILGGDILAGTEQMGTAISAVFDLTTNVTNVRVRIDPTKSATTLAWIGRLAAVGQFTEQTRVRRTTKGGAITWTDLGVVIGQLYEYALQAFGLFDELQLSALSEIRRVVPGDVAPPGSVVFEPGYPIVSLDVATAKFTTPSDLDYEGVKVVYYNKPTDGFGTSTGGNTTTSLVDDTKAWIPDSFAGYTLVITDGTGAGQIANIISNSATILVINTDTAWVTLPDATSSYEFYQTINVITDFGLPSTKDELRFATVGLGRYYFPTFDRALNVQTIYQAAFWDFDGQEDLVSPITTALVYDRTSVGKQSQTQFGMTLYSVPPAQEIILDTFEEVNGVAPMFVDSGVFSADGNTTRVFQDSTKNWVENELQDYWVRIYTPGANFNRILKIIENTQDTLVLDGDAPLPPDSMAYQILTHSPNRTPTATEYWVITDPSKLEIQDSRLTFIGASEDYVAAWINAGRSTGLRLEGVITRGTGSGHGGFGSNLMYASTSGGNLRCEFGVMHISDSIATLRFRYFSGEGFTFTDDDGTFEIGEGWTDLFADYPWDVGTAKKLSVEVDEDIHTFMIADEFGHDERIVGRVRLAGISPAQTYVGWSLHGDPEDGVIPADSLDEFRVMDFDSLVRIKYKLLPYEDPTTRTGEFLEIPWWDGQVESGGTNLLADGTKLWSVNELVGAFVRITDGPGQHSDIEIASNNQTTLIPVTPFNAALTLDSKYAIYEKYYTGTERLRWFATRLPKQAQFLLFHGERLGAPDEIEHRLLIDPNTIPELFLTLRQTAFGPVDGILTCDVEVDDDVSSYRLLLRKNNWPTINFVDPSVDPGDFGEPDSLYSKFFGNTNFLQQSFEVDLGDWYVGAIPYDTNGQRGPVAWGKITIVDGGAIPATGKFLALETFPPQVAAINVPLSPNPVVGLRAENTLPLAIAGVPVTAEVAGQWIRSGNIARRTFGFQMTGTTTVLTDSNGKATFNNLLLSGVAGGVDQIRFTAPDYRFVDSNLIAIATNTGAYIEIVTHATSAAVGVPFNVVLQLRNADGTVQSTPGVTININSVTLGLLPTSVVTDGTGKADFSLAISVGNAGTWQISYSATGYVSATANIGVGVGVDATNYLNNIRTFVRSAPIPGSITGGTFQAIYLYWDFDQTYDENDTRAKVDITIWSGTNTSTTKLLARTRPVWQQDTTAFSSQLGGTAVPDTSGNIQIPYDTARVETSTSTFFPQQTLNYEIVLKIDGVEKARYRRSYSYRGSLTIGSTIINAPPPPSESPTAPPLPGTTKAPNIPFSPDASIELGFSDTEPNTGANTSGFGILTPNTNWSYFDSTNGSVISDSASPISPPWCWRHRWPAGTSPGGGTGLWALWKTNSGEVLDWNEWYEADYFLFEGSTQEAPNTHGTWKPLGYWGVAGFNGAIYNACSSNSGTVVNGNRVAEFWDFTIRQQGDGISPYPSSSRFCGQIRVGRWYRFEIYMRMNTLFGTSANGLLRTWITDLATGAVQSKSFSNVEWRFASNPNKGFHRRHYDPIWGGSGGTNLSQDQFIRFAHVYVGTKAKSSTPTVSQPPVPTGLTNLPSGYSVVAEHNCSAVPSSTNGISGRFFNQPRGSNLTVVSTITNAPKSPNNVVNMRLDPGIDNGESSGQLGVSKFGTFTSSPEYGGVYVASWFRIVETTFENTTLGFKWLLLGSARDVTFPGAEIVLRLQSVVGQSGNALRVQYISQDFTNQTLNPQTSAPITLGAWHFIECLFETSDLGVSNGIFKCWVDGSLHSNHSTVLYRTATHYHKFYSAKYDIVATGVFDNGVDRVIQNNMQWDHFTVCVKP